jgi:hypothetical protein
MAGISNAGVCADDGDFLFPLLGWQREDGFEDERGAERGVFATTETHQPRARVGDVKAG